MINKKIASKIAAHTQTGRVLNFLATDLGPDYLHALKGAPAEEVLEQWIKKGYVDTVERAAELTRSANILMKLASKDKRKAVLHAVAANPHLPFEGAASLFKKWVDGSDIPAFKKLLAARSKTEVFKMISEEVASNGKLHWATRDVLLHELGLCGTRKALKLAYELTQEDDPASKQHRAVILRSACFRGSRVSTMELLEKMVELGEELRFRNTKSFNVSVEPARTRAWELELHRRVLRGSRDLQLKSLAVVEPKFISLMCLSALNGETKVTFREMVEKLDSSWTRVLREALEHKSITDPEFQLDLETALAMRRRKGDFGKDEQVRMTEEAALELLLHRDANGWGWDYVFSSVSSLPGKIKLVESESRDILLYRSRYFSLSELAQMLELGANPVSLGALTLHRFNNMARMPAEERNRRLNEHPTLVKLLVEETVNFPLPLIPALDADLISTLIKRIEKNGAPRNYIDVSADILAKNRKATREQRLQLVALCVRAGFGNALSTALTNTPAAGPTFKRGDLLEAYQLLKEENAKAEFRTWLQHALNTYECYGDWVEDALDITGADWALMSDAAAKTVHSRLEAAFGEDVILWQTALTLMSDWPGTVNELIETAKTL